MQHLQHISELGLLLKRLDVHHVIIAPGSRNAPLIQLFSRDSTFTCHSIVDERVAGFVALGMARHLDQPVVVVTTSGTAVMNLAPAVTEAFHQNVPMIILTADRPLEAIPQFNNQVIDQVAPFYNHSRGFYEFLPVLRSEQELRQALLAVAQLVQSAVTCPGGPVHVNIPMAEPLYETLPDPFLSGMEDEIKALFGNEEYLLPGPKPDHRKILVLAGMGVYQKEVHLILRELITTQQVVVVAENIANFPSDIGIANPELILSTASEQEREDLSPEFVLAFGGQVVSKRLKLYIQSLSEVESMVIKGDPLFALKKLKDSIEGKGTEMSNRYLQSWQQIETRILKKAGQYLENAPYCNFSAIHSALSAVPMDAVVHLGNSSTIRYAQLIPLRSDLTYYANRGTSGIDGCVSTAVGAALVSDQPHILLVGDLSFVYDSNSLWNYQFPENLKIIVINDGGGGIFRLLDGPDKMGFFEEFQVTHHPVSLELLSQSFGRGFQRAKNSEELSDKLEILFQPGSTLSILEVDTTSSENSRIFKEFFN